MITEEITFLDVSSLLKYNIDIEAITKTKLVR